MEQTSSFMCEDGFEAPQPFDEEGLLLCVGCEICGTCFEDAALEAKTGPRPEQIDLAWAH